MRRFPRWVPGLALGLLAGVAFAQPVPGSATHSLATALGTDEQDASDSVG